MFCNLDKIDKVATAPGEKLMIQTDHREPAEIIAHGAMAHLFALAKIGGAAEYGRTFPGSVVVYLCQDEPPDAFRQTIASAEAELHVGSFGNRVDADDVEKLDVDAIINRAMTEVAELSGIETCAQLAIYETSLAKELAAHRADFEDEPDVTQLQYWTSVLELAAIAGKLVGAKARNGRWRMMRLEHQVLPFLYTADDPRDPTKVRASFIVEKAIKFFETGPVESVEFLVRAYG